MRTVLIDKFKRMLPGYRANVARTVAQIWKTQNSFSQYDEDVILTKLVEKVRCPHRFIEFGFAPLENNCLRLALKENWCGTFIDAIGEHVRTVNDVMKHFNDLAIDAKHAFLTLPNINQIVRSSFPVGVISMDVDGNDWWFWNVLDLKPAVIVLEYNPVFGNRSITVPYDANFIRFKKHPSGLYHGASLSAFEKLGKRKGYSLVAIGMFGANAFFVRNDLLTVRPITARRALAEGKYILVRGEKPESHWGKISHLPYVEV